MRNLRRFDWLLPVLAAIAMSANLAASGFCCAHEGAGGKRVFDSVLGWVQICAPSKLAKSGTGPASGSHNGSHATCAAICAAATAFAFAYILSVFSSMAPGSSSPAPAFAFRHVRHFRLHPTGLGSRAPPLDV